MRNLNVPNHGARRTTFKIYSAALHWSCFTSLSLLAMKPFFVVMWRGLTMCPDFTESIVSDCWVRHFVWNLTFEEEAILLKVPIWLANHVVLGCRLTVPSLRSLNMMGTVAYSKPPKDSEDQVKHGIIHLNWFKAVAAVFFCRWLFCSVNKALQNWNATHCQI